MIVSYRFFLLQLRSKAILRNGILEQLPIWEMLDLLQDLRQDAVKPVLTLDIQTQMLATQAVATIGGVIAEKQMNLMNNI